MWAQFFRKKSRSSIGLFIATCLLGCSSFGRLSEAYLRISGKDVRETFAVFFTEENHLTIVSYQKSRQYKAEIPSQSQLIQLEPAQSAELRQVMSQIQKKKKENEDPKELSLKIVVAIDEQSERSLLYDRQWADKEVEKLFSILERLSGRKLLSLERSGQPQ